MWSFSWCGCGCDNKEYNGTMGQKLKRFKTVRGACKLFIHQVQAIEVVQEVLITEYGRVPIIWTVISAPAFEDEVLRPVYEAQGDVLRAIDRPLVNFRVVNLEEYPPESRDTAIPGDARLLWKRD